MIKIMHYFIQYPKLNKCLEKDNKREEIIEVMKDEVDK